MNAMARRMFELVEPIGVIPYAADEPNEAMFALGFTNYWDTYFAGRAAPLGLVPAEVVDAALRAVPVPGDVVTRMFHAASLLREHRGDGHIAALIAEGVGGLEAHVLLALDLGMPAERFGRIHHLPPAQLAAVIDGMRAR